MSCAATYEAVLEQEQEGDSGCPLCGEPAEHHDREEPPEIARGEALCKAAWWLCPEFRQPVNAGPELRVIVSEVNAGTDRRVVIFGPDYMLVNRDDFAAINAYRDKEGKA